MNLAQDWNQALRHPCKLLTNLFKRPPGIHSFPVPLDVVRPIPIIHPGIHDLCHPRFRERQSDVALGKPVPRLLCHYPVGRNQSWLILRVRFPNRTSYTPAPLICFRSFCILPHQGHFPSRSISVKQFRQTNHEPHSRRTTPAPYRLCRTLAPLSNCFVTPLLHSHSRPLSRGVSFTRNSYPGFSRLHFRNSSSISFLGTSRKCHQSFPPPFISIPCFPAYCDPSGQPRLCLAAIICTGFAFRFQLDEKNLSNGIK